MSGALPDNGVTARAIGVEEQAAAWLRRRHFSAWSSEQQSELETWLAQSLTHRVAYVRLEAVWNRMERLAALHIPAPERGAARSMKSVASMAVASLALVAVIGLSAMRFFLDPHEQSYATGLGGHRAVRLADGTQIELNTDTSIRARVTNSSRTIWLDRGEAYFQVKHDAAHPFVVIAGDRRMTDLGTKFLARREAAALRVSVLEGSVRFDAMEGHAPEHRTLLKGDVAIATGDKMSVTNSPARKLASELGWRHGELIFEHTTLADAASEFNRYNREKIVVADPESARVTIGGTFQTGSVELFGHMAQDVLGLHVVNRGDAIVISR